MVNSGTIKRRRTAADTLHISNLPAGFIVDVSAYLPKPSRAILAVAFTTSSSSSLWQTDYEVMHRLSPISKAIVSAQQWYILDFEDVEKELANKLTDDDISAVLKSINAQDVLKRLKLCGCINIEGIGLHPLQGSIVLEQIDLSLVGKYDNPYPAPESKISQEVVAPILNSIVSSEGCSLKCIQFPYKWLGRTNHLRDFRRRYNELFSGRNMICSKCNAEIQGISSWILGNHNRKICYDCLAPLCGDCSLDNLNDGFCLHCCITCDKTYCTDCVKSTRCNCNDCLDTKCKGCGDMEECDECGVASCENCLNTCGGCNRTRCVDCVSYHRCEERGCFNGNCEDCYDGKEYDVKYCEQCELAHCNGCKIGHVKKYGVEGGCSACVMEIVPLLLQQQVKLTKENEELAKDNQELRDKVESMSLS